MSSAWSLATPKQLCEWFILNGHLLSANVEENVGVTLLDGVLAAGGHRGVVEVVPAVVVRRIGGVVAGGDAVAVVDDHCRQVVQRRLGVAAVGVAGFVLSVDNVS